MSDRQRNQNTPEGRFCFDSALPERMLVAHCHDWAVVALGYKPQELVAVVDDKHVLCATPAVREYGVTPGTKRGTARERCPHIQLVPRDFQTEMKKYIGVIDALTEVAPRIGMYEPGTYIIPTLGPSRYFGGDDALAQHLSLLLDELLKENDIYTFSTIGVADGIFPAILAARQSTPNKNVFVIPRGASAKFLSDFSVRSLPDMECIDVLWRLGIKTLHQLADMQESDIIGRFGNEGVTALRLARGLDVNPIQNREIETTFAIQTTHDPPLAYIEQAAFAARNIAHQLCTRLADEGITCTRLRIDIQTVSGDDYTQTWFHNGSLHEAQVVERLRWQLDTWLTSRNTQNTAIQEGVPSVDGISLLTITPEGLLPNNGTQLSLWNQEHAVDERVLKAVEHVCGLLGDDSVLQASLHGGRILQNEVRFTRWSEQRIHNTTFDTSPISILARTKTLLRTKKDEEPIWPGRLPPPYPATVYSEPLLIDILDCFANTVTVSLDGRPSNAPYQVKNPQGSRQTITKWSGPWLVEERWWDAKQYRKIARFQVITADGDAYLIAREKQRWWLHAKYD